MGILKTLRYGKDFSMGSPAACIAMFERLKPDIKPESFNPLIVLKGGISVIGGEYATDGIMIANDWINRCQDAGATTKNAILCLAANYDDHPGMVALALEAAMICTKSGTAEGVKLTLEEFADIAVEVYFRDWAGIRTLMTDTWQMALKPGANPGEPMKTRSVWRKELGYDVLIHPVTLEPCRAADGSILKYCGLGGTEKRTEFHFRRMEGDQERNDTFRISFPPNKK